MLLRCDFKKIAKLGVRDIMGPCVMTLIFSGLIMGLGLYFFA